MDGRGVALQRVGFWTTMPEWSEEAVILGVRPAWRDQRGDNRLRPWPGDVHAGLVRGGSQPKMRSALQPGSRVQASWRARLAETLGYMTIEPVRSTAALVLDDGLRLAGLASICALLDGCLAEREAQPALYAATRSLLDLVCIEGRAASLDRGLCALGGRASAMHRIQPRS